MPSVLSPKPVSRTSVLTACARRARSLTVRQSPKASCLNGSVTLRPLPPAARKRCTAAAKPSSGDSSRPYSRSWEVARANSAWIQGDLECATGLPTSAYRSLMDLFSPDLVALAEEPSSRDDQEVGVAPDIGRERGERPRHAHDLERRRVQHLEAGRTVELDRLDVAVGADGDREPQIAVDPAARFGRVVERAH